MTREEHLAWAKSRALKYADQGDLGNTVASMGSDLGKHEAWRDSPIMPTLMLLGMSYIVQRDSAGVRRWIEGFN